MTTARELKTLLSPLLRERLPGLRMERTLLFYEPIGFYLRGFSIQIST